MAKDIPPEARIPTGNNTPDTIPTIHDLVKDKPAKRVRQKQDSKKKYLTFMKRKKIDMMEL